MALSQEIQPSGKVLSFAAAKTPAEEGEHRGEHRDEFDRLNAQAEANWRFLNALATLALCQKNPDGEAEVMDALDQALVCVIEATGASDGALLVMDDASGDLIFTLVHGDTPKNRLLWRRVPAGRGVAHWAAEHRHATIVNNTSDDERFYSGIDAASGYRTRSIVAAPLLDGEKVIGVVEALNKNSGEFFSLSDQNHLTVMAYLGSTLLIQLRDRQAE